MPPARRKGYTYLEQPPVGTAAGTWAVVRDSDSQGLGSFPSNADVYAAIDEDRIVEAERAPERAAFARTHLQDTGPDLRVAAADELVPDGSRRPKP